MGQNRMMYTEIVLFPHTKIALFSYYLIVDGPLRRYNCRDLGLNPRSRSRLNLIRRSGWFVSVYVPKMSQNWPNNVPWVCQKHLEIDYRHKKTLETIKSELLNILLWGIGSVGEMSANFFVHTLVGEEGVWQSMDTFHT